MPRSADSDVSVRVTPQGGGLYAFDPFPFSGIRVEVACSGRYVEPFPEDREFTRDEIGQALCKLPTTTQKFVFVPG